VRDAVELEENGKPTITISHDKFERAAKSHAKGLGMPDLPLLIEPAPKGGNVSTDVRDIAEANLDLVVRALTGSGDGSSQ
jgi:hypothetical protein